MENVAADHEERLARTLTELGKAKAKLSEFDRRFRAPRETVERASKEEIFAAQKASLEGSPRWKREQKAGTGKDGTRRQVIEYRNYLISYYQRPVSGFGDWRFLHKDYDGPGIGCSDHRCGYAETPANAKVAIDAQYADLGLDENGYYPRDGLHASGWNAR